MTLRDPSSWPVAHEQAIRARREELSISVYVHVFVFKDVRVSQRLPR